MHLSQISSPAHVKALSSGEIGPLADEIRAQIMDVVGHTGGHLSSNLGVVELTIALHRALDCPRDKIIFDVGHQCYAHKLLTGRYEPFSTLRTLDGISGFPRREESEYDAFGAGHASTAISAALGMARARDLMGENYRVTAVVGDGALTGGMCYEALNDAGSRKTQLMVILNDNGMSISRNVGALSGQLTRLRVSRGWLGMKKAVSEALRRLPVGGEPLLRAFQRIRNGARNILVRDKFFTSLGFRYFGPIDGHDPAGMERLFLRIRDLQEPVVVHVVTTKGQGYQKAEQHPDAFHGVAPLYIETQEAGRRSGPSMGTEAGTYVTELAGADPRIGVICAAMADGTGFSGFAKAYPQRFFDVGIAEEHAVTLAAGMAAAGMRPFVAIYETFLQRAFDQMMEDVCLQGLPVCFLMDRAGLGGEDGATHHGIYGLSMLRAIPGLVVLSPRDGDELRQMIRWALSHPGPCAIRYPRNGAECALPAGGFAPGEWQCLREGRDGAVLTTSAIVDECLAAAAALEKEGVSLSVHYASSLQPMDEGLLCRLASQGKALFTVEEHDIQGGFGSAVAECCARLSIPGPRAMLGLPHGFIPHGSRRALLERLGLDGAAIAQSIKEAMKK